MLTGIGGLIASISVRRGFAVVATIAVLLLGNGVVTAIQGISEEQGEPDVGEVAGLFSPYSLYRGGDSALTDELFLTPPIGTTQTAAYFAVMIARRASPGWPPSCSATDGSRAGEPQ